MRFFEFATVVTAIGCGTGVIITTVDKVLGGRRGGQGEALRLSKERLEEQERELAALRRQNEQLQRQLEWHDRLLERGQREPLPSGR
jgi:hypothetical protein